MNSNIIKIYLTIILLFKSSITFDYYEKIRDYYINNNLTYIEKSTGYIWWHWDSWSDSCERKCSERFGYKTRQRICLYCENGVCAESDTTGCKLDDIRTIQKKFCYNPNDCNGFGAYTGTWDQWQAFKSCSDIINDKQVFKRRCISSRKSLKYPKIEPKCTDLTHLGDKKAESCIYKDNNCKLSEWSEWKFCDLSYSVANFDDYTK